jgi:hypothetical protein
MKRRSPNPNVRGNMKCECGHPRNGHRGFSAHCEWKGCGCREFKPRPGQRGLIHLGSFRFLGIPGYTRCSRIVPAAYRTFTDEEVDCQDCISAIDRSRPREAMRLWANC